MLTKDCFDFYGLTIEVSSSSANLVEEVTRDFAYFRVPTGHGQVQVEMRLAPPPYGELPSLPASIFTPRNVCFQNREHTYIDYFGRGLAVFDREQKECVIYGTRPAVSA